MPWKLSVTAFVCRLGSLTKKTENREIDRGLLKCFLLLQSMFPPVCNLGVEKSIADCASAVREVEEKRGRKWKHHQQRRNPSTQSEESPKG